MYRHLQLYCSHPSRYEWEGSVVQESAAGNSLQFLTSAAFTDAVDQDKNVLVSHWKVLKNETKTGLKNG